MPANSSKVCIVSLPPSFLFLLVSHFPKRPIRFVCFLRRFRALADSLPFRSSHTSSAVWWSVLFWLRRSPLLLLSLSIQHLVGQHALLANMQCSVIPLKYCPSPIRSLFHVIMVTYLNPSDSTTLSASGR